ncbi:glycosyltransferase family 4 protein [Flavihumibacter sp. UBA7668]|uniref:glycosyltransferase family 4 protein n=1 Tax=Flavihumibacter sp. UBA7668 TaxID=1946542 RepID=UPI0025C57119|nr:glycosyltransferase family 4 protein [Flavihumibacter sp. UBA7668]
MRISKSRKIAFVSNNAWSIYNFRLDVIKALRNDGHQIIIITPFNSYVEKITELGCEHISIDFDNKSINPIVDIRFFLNLNKLYKRLRPDLIFHYVAKPNIYGTMAAKRNGIASVAIITGLGFAFSKKNLLYAIVKLLYRFSLNGATDVLFLNNDDAQLFAREKIVPLKKINVLPGEGINTTYFAPFPPREKNERLQFLMSCRMLKSKGVEVFVEASRLLKLKGYEFDSVILGFFEKNHPDSIAPATVESWQLDGLINYLGFREDVRPSLAGADVFVFPSFYNEGVPRSLLEAASMELPIITTLNKGCRDVVEDKVNGFLCKMEDPFDLASKMEAMILMEEAARKKMGQKGRQLVISKFGMGKVIHEYRRIVAHLF